MSDKDTLAREIWQLGYWEMKYRGHKVDENIIPAIAAKLRDYRANIIAEELQKHTETCAERTTLTAANAELRTRIAELEEAAMDVVTRWDSQIPAHNFQTVITALRSTVENKEGES